jgi:phosphoglycerol transferase MdoB-like AlkP superfamily enzyme
VRGRFVRLAAYALTALLGLALAAHAYVGFFTRYVADDYCTAAAVRTAGLLVTQRHFYLAWSGRFSFTLTISLVELLGTGVVPYLPTAALVCWLAATTWAVHELLNTSLGRRPLLFSFLLAELIVYATVADNVNGVFEALYWQTGMLTYVAPLVILTALAGFYARSLRHAKLNAPRAALLLPLTFAVAFYAGGFSETSALMQIGAFAAAVAATLALSDATRGRRLLPSLISGLTGSVRATAPERRRSPRTPTC